MRFRNKILGLTAAFLLALSAAGGAVAASNTGTGTVSVTLRGTTGLGCLISNITGGTFGDAQWNGSTYTNPPDTQLNFKVTWDANEPLGGPGQCDATIRGSATFNGTTPGNTYSFPIGKLSYSYGAGTPVAMTTSDQTLFTGVNASETALPIPVTLSLDVSGALVQPDTYSTTLTITLTNS